MLKRYCDKYGIDYYEVDNKLTFSENKQHLRKLVRMMEHSLDAFELARWESLQEQYMKEHILEYYTLCQLSGETKSSDVGKPFTALGFSLEAYVKETRS
jgi:hypothetical protein